MRTKLIVGFAGIVIAVAAFVAGILVERRFPSLFASEPSPPTLITPVEDAILPDGDLRKGTSFVWEFRWSEVSGAERYQLKLNHRNVQWLEITAEEPHYRLVMPAQIAGLDEKRLSWQVRVQTRGGWSKWSDLRWFAVGQPGQ